MPASLGHSTLGNHAKTHLWFPGTSPLAFQHSQRSFSSPTVRMGPEQTQLPAVGVDDFQVCVWGTGAKELCSVRVMWTMHVSPEEEQWAAISASTQTKVQDSALK